MSEGGFNRQLKMVIRLLNHLHDFLNIQITFSNKRCQCMPAYIYCFSAPNFAASLWQSFDSPTDTDLIQSIKPSFFILKSFEKLFYLRNFSAVIDMFAFTLLFLNFKNI